MEARPAQASGLHETTLRNPDLVSAIQCCLPAHDPKVEESRCKDNHNTLLLPAPSTTLYQPLSEELGLRRGISLKVRAGVGFEVAAWQEL
jgi:hypothetical protein